MHADRGSRVVLGLLGLLLLAAGVAAILAGTRLFGDDQPGRSLLDNPVADYIGRNGDWFWPVLALIVVALVLWWLARVLFATSRIGQVSVRVRGPGEQTTLAAGALTAAVSDEIEGYRGVESVRVRLVGTAVDPELAVAVDAHRGTDLAGLRHRIETGALAHARQALENPDLPATVDLTLRRRDGARVT
jgi:hypothetical protein